MKVFGLAHVAIIAENYEETASFYTNLLQFKKAHHWTLEDYHIKEACMLGSLDGQTYIEFLINMQESRVKDTYLKTCRECTWTCITFCISRRFGKGSSNAFKEK